MSQKVCLVGYGYWGKNLLRNLLEINHGYEIVVAEKLKEKRDQLSIIHSSVLIVENVFDLMRDKSVIAVVVATETTSHFQIVKSALENGKHVFVEKPITTSLVEAEELAALAKKNGLVLAVDHVFLYHPVVQKMKYYFNNNELGRINYIDSTRINLGIYQQDVNVLWDLACHDIAVINYLVEEQPHSVRAIGRVNPEHGVEDIAYLFLYYPSNMLVQINASWASPVKMRKMIIGGEKRMLIYDDIEPTNKLIIYDYEQNTRFDENKTKLTDYRLGNVTIPKYEPTEALRNALIDFLNCLNSNSFPLANGENALSVVNILEKAQQSLKLNGAIISLN
jgi:predicted dehydrogenase